MLLAVDTSTRSVGIAFYDGAQVVAELTWASRNYHTVELAPAVDTLMGRIGVQVTDIAALGVATGPGSFTALRIGLAFAKGLAFSRGVPLIGVPTLDIVAAAQPLEEMPLAAVLQAGRSRLAVGWYQAREGRWQSIGEVENLTLDELMNRLAAPTRLLGELDAEARRRLETESAYARVASPAQSTRRPGVLAELAWVRWQAGESDDPATLSPLYLHHGDPIPGG